MGQLISIQFITFAVITTVKGTVGLGLVPIARLIKIEDELALHCILLMFFLDTQRLQNFVKSCICHIAK